MERHVLPARERVGESEGVFASRRTRRRGVQSAAGRQVVPKHRWWLAGAGLAIAGVAVAVWVVPGDDSAASSSSGVVFEADRTTLAADGASLARLRLRSADGRPLSPSDVTFEFLEGLRRARVESVRAEGGGIVAVIRAGILPGPIVLEVRGAGTAPARVELEAVLDPADRAGDGTPDFLRLDDAADREAFRRWFTFLAEWQAFRPPPELPREINDCAALLRFAYREALREHDGEWVNVLGLPALPAAPQVRKYKYPYTPLGAGLFRVRPGAFRAEDVASGAFAQFADADTLRRFNSHFVSRDVALAQPGDLLFYRQLEQDQPFHAMIFLGASPTRRVEPGVLAWVVYHTGASAESSGEIRRVPAEELLAHPEPRWRPVPGNPNFLGVYRWNILRQTD
jgi:uncharacterized protein YfaT (DUF1175 family)